MSLEPFAPVTPNKIVGVGDPPGDMNNTWLALAAGGTTYNVLNTAYAGGADPTGSADSTAAINACVAAATAAGMPVMFPAGTFKVTSTLNWKLPSLVVQGAGPGNTIISMSGSSLNIPVIELAGTTLDIGGFTVQYVSQPASGNTSAAAIAIGDNTVGPLFGCRLHEINIFNVNTGMTIVSTTNGGCSSNTFENIEINGFTYSALNMQAASGTGGGDCTGNHWSNIYVHNNPLGSRTPAAFLAVYFKSFDENVFNQLNIEHGNHFLHDVMQFELCGNTIINSLHFEDLDMAGSGSPNIAFISQINGGSTIVNGLTIRSPILTGSVANPVVRFNTAAGNVTVNGFNEVIGSGGISTVHPYCDFGSQAGCTMVVTDVAASLTTTDYVSRTTGDVLSVGAVAAVSDWLNAVTMFGADPTGTADSTTAIQNALSALPAGGGIVYLPAGTYKVSSTLTMASQLYAYLWGAGRWATTISFTGTGDCLRIYNTDTTGILTGGGVYDLTIDGTSAGNGSTGLHLGDMRATEINLAIQNFSGTGSIGLYLDNEYAWTEECHGYCWLSNNTQNVVFNVGTTTTTSTNSFGYSDFYFEILAKFNQDGVVFQNGALLYHSSLKVKANFAGSASNQTNAVIRITGQMPAGHPDTNYSLIQSSRLEIQAELGSGAGTAPATIIFNSASNNAINTCYGIMDFTTGASFSNAQNSSGSFAFDGICLGDSKLWRTALGVVNFNVGSALVTGSTIQPFSTIYTAAPSSAATGVIIEKWPAAMGSPVEFTVINGGTAGGSATITFDVAATSHVATGASCVIQPGFAMKFAWNPVSALWYQIT